MWHRVCDSQLLLTEDICHNLISLALYFFPGAVPQPGHRSMMESGSRSHMTNQLVLQSWPPRHSNLYAWELVTGPPPWPPACDPGMGAWQEPWPQLPAPVGYCSGRLRSWVLSVVAVGPGRKWSGHWAPALGGPQAFLVGLR